MDLNKGVYISTYGCQMNVNDTDRMYALLEMANYTPVNSPDQADLILINSCSVREKPVHKVYSEVGKYRKLKDRNPNLRIGVGGCVGQQEKGQLIQDSPSIDFVFGTDNIDLLPEIVARAQSINPKTGKSDKIVEAQFQHRAPYHIETLIRSPGVSTFVNITKGCDNFCTFCVVPYTRGREKSRPMTQILEDIHKLTARGVKEITLLGQNVNSYKSECGADFADLMDRLARDTDLMRLRFTTSHPKDFDEKLVEVLARHQPKVCEYIHLPFQAGSSRVLEMMNRGYTREEYIAKVQMIKRLMPNVVLSTDIIVGFPSETEEDFQQTLDMVGEIGFETIFAFKYSPRPFTKAARFDGQIEEAVKDDRLARLFAYHDALARGLVEKYEGQVLDVLVEGYDSKQGNMFGRSSQNKTVFFAGPKNEQGQADGQRLIGQSLKIRITKAHPATLRGEWVQGAFLG
jgi:tRNA-2-methylthio-N6-dimethylallyladenosine synthase